MMLWDKIKGTLSSNDETPTPRAASFAARPDTIYAPVSGLLMSVEEINDEVLSSKLLGDGYGILPVGDVIYAPAAGRIDMTTVTNHAIGMLTSEGVEIIIHVGLGTVTLNGKGFTRFVNEGDQVQAGTPLLSFDQAVIRDAGYEDVVTCVVPNTDQLATIQHVGGSNTLIGDRPLVKVGDPLLIVKK